MPGQAHLLSSGALYDDPGVFGRWLRWLRGGTCSPASGYIEVVRAVVGVISVTPT
jgi:hypothetical protein